MANDTNIKNFEGAFEKWKTEIDIQRVIKKDYGRLSLNEFLRPLEMVSHLQEVYFAEQVSLVGSEA